MNGIIRLIRIFLRIEQKLDLIVNIMSMQVTYTHDQQNKPDWLDNQDVMQKLKISESTLKRHRLSGIIPSTRIRGKYYYNNSDIQKLLRDGMV